MRFIDWSSDVCSSDLNRPIEMHPDPACFIGIDIGTQGARAVLMDHQGNLLASGEEGFPLSDDSREEQSPEDWWKACLFTLRELIRQAGKNAGLTTIKAIAVTSTSGPVIPLDRKKVG